MDKLKAILKRSRVLVKLRSIWLELSRPKNFKSADYWQNRYAGRGNSGSGSYGRLAEYKNKTINGLVAELGVLSVIELGCGDGNQLVHANYPSYLGFDPSEKAVEICRTKFKDKPNFQFKVLPQSVDERADLSMSLDVIYHLVEDDVFNKHMGTLFDIATKYVLVYSINRSDLTMNGHHVKTRKFSDWIDQNRKEWKLVKHIPNEFPYTVSERDNTSISDFFLYSKIA